MTGQPASVLRSTPCGSLLSVISCASFHGGSLLGVHCWGFTAGGSLVACGTGGAPAPVDDLGLVDDEARVVGGGQARRVPDRAVDVGDGTAGAAHHVVVVVVHTG